MIFSIIIPTYNRLEDLKKSLDSVFKQNFNQDDFEVIVVPNGEVTDGTIPYLNELSQSQKNLIIKNTFQPGVTYARQLGSGVAHGKYHLQIDDDTILDDKDTLKKLQEIFDAAGCEAVTGLENGSLSTKKRTKTTGIGSITKWGIVKANFSDAIFEKNINTEVDHARSCFLAYTKEIFEKVSGFDCRYDDLTSGMGFRGETDFCAKIKNRGGKIVLNKNLVYTHKVADRPEKAIRRGAGIKHYRAVYLTHFLFVFKNIKVNKFLWAIFQIFIGDTKVPGIAHIAKNKLNPILFFVLISSLIRIYTLKDRQREKSRMKNILITTENYYPIGGGIEQFVRGISEYLTNKDYNIYIFTQHYPGLGLEGEKKIKEGIINYSPLMTGSLENPFGVMKNKKLFAQYIKEKNIDFVFANNHNSLAWIKAAKIANIPVIYGCHGVGLMDPFKSRMLKPNDEISWGFPGILSAIKWLWMEKRPLWKKILLYPIFFFPLPMFLINKPIRNYWVYKESMNILNRADGRYGNSGLTATLFKNKKNTIGFPLAINATDPLLHNYYAPTRDDSYIENLGLKHKQYIVCTSRLHHIKGQEYLIKAMAQIKNDNIKLALVGTGSLFMKDDKNDIGAYGQKLKEIIKNLGIEDRVVFTGLLDMEEKNKLYTGAIATVVPSIWLETFGYVTLESMACETPVVITGNCGSAQCVDHDCGVIVSRKNEKEIAEAINKIENKSVEMGKNARAKVLANYDWEILGPEYEKIFYKIYNKKTL